MSLISTIDILGAVKTRLENIELLPGTRLFQKVAFYPEPRLVQALEDLRIYSRRICLVIPSGNRYADDRERNKLRTDVWRELVLLMADVDYGTGQKALVGAEHDQTQPGVVTMQDLVERDLLSQGFPFTPKVIRAVPIAAEALELTKAEQAKAASRKAWSMTWEFYAGFKLVTEA